MVPEPRPDLTHAPYPGGMRFFAYIDAEIGARADLPLVKQATSLTL